MGGDEFVRNCVQEVREKEHRRRYGGEKKLDFFKNEWGILAFSSCVSYCLFFKENMVRFL